MEGRAGWRREKVEWAGARFGGCTHRNYSNSADDDDDTEMNGKIGYIVKASIRLIFGLLAHAPIRCSKLGFVTAIYVHFLAVSIWPCARGGC